MSVPRFWREIPHKYRLLGSRCRSCGAVYHPRRHVCPRCGSRDLEDVGLSKRGRLLAFTVVRRAPSDLDEYKPYIVGLVELQDGVRVLSQIVDCDPSELRPGMELEATLRRIRAHGPAGVIEYGYKFRPVIEWEPEGEARPSGGVSEGEVSAGEESR